MYNNAKDIKVSEHSIEIAYKRYLADSAPGFIVIAIAIYKFHSYIEMSFELQTKIFFYFLLFLLSTPLGLAVNAVGYLFLDKIVHYIEQKWVDKLLKIESMQENSLWKIFLKTAAEDEFFGVKCKKDLISSSNQWICVTRHIVRIMDIYHHDRYHAHEHESGAHIFLRNVAFIILFFLILQILQIEFFFNILQILQIEFFFNILHILIEFFISLINVVVAIFVIIFLLLCSAYVSYYYHLAMLCDAYILCSKHKTECKDVLEITECLIRESKKKPYRR